MKKYEIFKEIFTEKTKCDFCNKDNRIIVRAIVIPLSQLINDVMTITGGLVAKKCMKCYEMEVE